MAASATKIALSQTVPAAQGVALTGAAGTFTAANIAASQTLAGAGAVTLASGVAPATTGMFGGGLPYKTFTNIGVWLSQIYITSAGNDSGITFTILGRNELGNVTSEVVTGSNTSVAASTFRYSCLYSITASGATASTITIGSFAPAQLDVARQVLFTSGGNDAGITFTIVGYDARGNRISEVVTGANGTATSVLSYYQVVKITTSGATASTLTVGTNTVADSPWVQLDTWAMGTLYGQLVVTGTVNCTVAVTNDDPNSQSDSVAMSAVAWDTTYAGIIGATTNASFGLAQSPAYVKLTLNSGSGSARLTLNQHNAVPY